MVICENCYRPDSCRSEGECSLYGYSDSPKADPGVDVSALLLWMKAHGSSVLLNWGEDDDLWELSWITSGDRFVGFSKTIDGAIREAISKAKTEAGDTWPWPD